MMNIVVASSREYLKYAKVMLLSLFESNKNDKISVYYYHEEEMKEEIKELQRFANNYGNSVIDMDVEDKVKSVFVGKSSYRWNNAVWYRYFCIQDLYGKCDRALVLGIDTIVKKDISEFYYRKMNNSICLVEDMGMKSVAKYGKEQYERINLPNGYGNSDVCLIDIEGLGGKISLEDMLKNDIDKQYHYMDQDVWNYCYSQYIEIIKDYKYNYMTYMAEDIYEYGESNNLLKEAAIVHYAGDDKPWRNYRGRQSDNIWIEYAKRAIDKNEIEYLANLQLLRSSYDSRRERKKVFDNYLNLQKIIQLYSDKKRFNEIKKEYNLQNVALYGIGVVGKSFVDLFCKELSIKYIIDSKQYNFGSYQNIAVGSLDNINNITELDSIIITVSYDLENIKKDIRNINDRVRIVSIDEILKFW